MIGEYDSLIREHYQRVARINGDSANSTMEDQYIRDAELNYIVSEVKRFTEWVKPDPKIFEVGCGNGHLLSCLRQKFPQASLSAIEFTPELRQIASERKLDGVTIEAGDARRAECFPKECDIIISERVIINILDMGHQRVAFENIAASLKMGGIYIMVESFIEPLHELNRARKEVKLPPIEPSYQNKYLSDRMVYRMQFMGLQEITPCVASNYLSSHFFLTRVFHWLVRPEGGKLKANHVVRFFDQAIPPGIGNYAPIRFRLFRRVDPLQFVQPK